ncbi:MAG: hypothetical protein QOE70_895 [Chthoniobacter sp.]|jgi:hypothetical protein|nr:hypothetical protein [Chthoniobacter sp.]
MSKPAIAKVWTFASSSGRGSYETLLFVDNTTSCNCPGWTRRTTASGDRSCKHTRLVDQDRADDEAESFHSYTDPAAPVAISPAATQASPAFGMRSRKLA